MIHSTGMSASRRITGRIAVGWWFLCLSLIMVFLAFESVKWLSSAALYLGLWTFMAVGFFVFVKRWSYSAILGRRFDVLEIPIYLGSITVFFIQVFGIAPYINDQYLRVLSSVAYLPMGLLLTGTGLFCMLLGYALVSRSYSPGPGVVTHGAYRSPSFSLTFLIYAGVLGLRLALFASGAGEDILGATTVRLGGDWYQWVEYLIELRWFFIALVTLQVGRGKWPLAFFFLVLSIECVLGTVSGWASVLPKVLVLVSGCLMYAWRRLPWRTIIPAILIMLGLSVFSVPIARSMRYSGPVTWASVITSTKATWGQGFSHGWYLFADLIIGRQTVIAQTPSILLSLIPTTLPYLPWQDLAVAPVTFIPRAIWPSKPVYTSLGTWLTAVVFGGPTSGSSAAVTMAGNAYMYGGWGVVIVGMFTLGVAAALLYRWVAVPGLMHDQVGLLAVYAAVVIANFHLGEGDFVGIWQGLVQRLVVFLVVARILCARR